MPVFGYVSALAGQARKKPAAKKTPRGKKPPIPLTSTLIRPSRRTAKKPGELQEPISPDSQPGSELEFDM